MGNQSKHRKLISIFTSFLRLGLTAFGGPAMILHIKDLSVNQNKWIDEETFKDGISLCQAIPGATAMQMAAYVGLRSNGLIGGFSSYLGFGLPAFILMLILSIAYAHSHNLPLVISLFKGLQIIVVAIIAHATCFFGRDILKNFRKMFIALISAALLWLNVSPFAVIVGAALAGNVFFMNMISPAFPLRIRDGEWNLLRAGVLSLLFLLIGLSGLYIIDIELFHLAALMIKIDIFAFGGGFSSVPLMLHEIVDVRKWIDSRTFMDGIALGQVTPGPIVITATFVGYLTHGVAGALVATVAVFTPSFMILIGIIPFFDRLKASEYFLRAIKGVLATFVGLLFYATLKFSSSVTWDTVSVVLVLGAFAALMKKIDILYVVLIGSVISVIIF